MYALQNERVFHFRYTQKNKMFSALFSLDRNKVLAFNTFFIELKMERENENDGGDWI